MEVVQAYIDRIEEVNPLINAVVKDRQDSQVPTSLPTSMCVFSTGGHCF